MKGLVRSLGRGDPAAQPIRKVSYTLKDLAIAIADGAPGFGTVVIGGLPQGNLLFLGAVAYLQFSSEDAQLTDTFDGDFAVGTTATADGAIAGTEADIIPSTAMGAATAKVSPVIRGASTDALGGGILDNTDGSLELNLNVLIDDAAISGAVDATVDGVLHLAVIVLGDD